MVIIDLSKFVPFELEVDKETSKIVKAGDIELVFSTRKLFDMKDVIYDKNWLNSQQENFDLYYMYRDLTRDEDKPIFQKHGVRFDITIIPPNFLGAEYIKTAGHFHPEAKEGFSFPEVYEVMFGKGLYLLQKEKKEQKKKRKNKTLDPYEVLIISAKAGDQILIPPGYGHVTINPSKETPLIMNNLVSSEFSSIYEPIKKQKGAVYLYHHKEVWIRNPTCKDKVIVKEKFPSKIVDKPFYLSFIENPEQWIFLNEPWTKENWL
ncbi:MAG: glucose-6-phosphate isomerase [Candidatus Heimdallarchaeota archaeon]